MSAYLLPHFVKFVHNKGSLPVYVSIDINIIVILYTWKILLLFPGSKRIANRRSCKKPGAAERAKNTDRNGRRSRKI